MFGFRKQAPPPTATIHQHFFPAPLFAPEAVAVAAACFESVALSVRRREAEAARADLARRAVGVDPREVAMTPLAEWMVGR